jgi:hypothetical protein
MPTGARLAHKVNDQKCMPNRGSKEPTPCPPDTYPQTPPHGVPILSEYLEELLNDLTQVFKYAMS